MAVFVDFSFISLNEEMTRNIIIESDYPLSPLNSIIQEPQWRFSDWINHGYIVIDSYGKEHASNKRRRKV